MSPYETPSTMSAKASGAPTIESLWAGGNTMEAGLSAGVGGVIGAGLGSLFTNGFWGNGVGTGGVGRGVGVATGGSELLLLQQQIDQVIANNDAQTSILQNNNLMKVLSDLGIQNALAIGATEAAKDAAINAGVVATTAANAAGKEAVMSSESTKDYVYASVVGAAKDVAANVNALAMANTRDLLTGLSAIGLQATQNKYEASIQADANTRALMDSIRDSIDVTKEEGCKTRALITEQEICALRAENLKLANHIALEEEFEEHDRRRSRRDSEVTNINVNNNNTQIQNQIADLANIMRSFIVARPTA